MANKAVVLDEVQPVSVRLLHYRGEERYRYVMIEQPPHRQLVHTAKRTFSVPLPWTYYGIEMYDHYKSCLIRAVTNATKRIERLGDYLYLSPYPNLNGGISPCYPYSHAEVVKAQSTHERVLASLHVFWDSAANPDYWRYGYYRACGVAEEIGGTGQEDRDFYAFLRQWEKLSVSDMFSLTWRTYADVASIVAMQAPFAQHLELIDRPLTQKTALDARRK